MPPWPPSSGSSNASSSDRPRACSGHACSPSSSSGGSSGRWRRNAWPAADRTLVPNRFVVHLNPDDLAGFGDMTAIARDRARRRGADVRPRAPLHARRPPARRPARPTRPSSAPTSGSSPGSPTRSPGRCRPGAADRRRPSGVVGLAARPTRWSSRCPRPTAPRPGCASTVPGGASRSVDVDGTDLTIGRAADNDLVLGDGRVSRHHGRLTGRRGTLVYIDLGSTNGSRVNGVAVGELVLGAGDRLELGDTSSSSRSAGDGT